MKYSESIPIHQIRQFIFCPRIPYYQLIHNLKASKPIWMNIGLKYHEAQLKLMKRRTLQRFGLETATVQMKVNVVSTLYNFHGEADFILETETEVFPVEIKNSSSTYKNQVYQMFAYGLAYSEMKQKQFRKGFLMLENKGKVSVYEFSEKDKQELIGLFSKLRENLEMSCLPSSSAQPSQCIQCEYLMYCNDRDM